jgi:hypothetical protein
MVMIFIEYGNIFILEKTGLLLCQIWPKELPLGNLANAIKFYAHAHEQRELFRARNQLLSSIFLGRFGLLLLYGDAKCPVFAIFHLHWAFGRA